jgi:type IV pilus assembly protein PilE
LSPAIKRAAHGVTLVELLLVITIIGILVAIAYPSYTAQMQKGRRAEAKAKLHEILQLQERYYAQNNVYTVSIADLGLGAGPIETEHGSHRISLAAGPSGNIATSVTVSAVPLTPDSLCGTLTISNTMATEATGTQPVSCW